MHLPLLSRYSDSLSHSSRILFVDEDSNFSKVCKPEECNDSSEPYLVVTSVSTGIYWIHLAFQVQKLYVVSSLWAGTNWSNSKPQTCDLCSNAKCQQRELRGSVVGPFPHVVFLLSCAVSPEFQKYKNWKLVSHTFMDESISHNFLQFRGHVNIWTC